MGDIAALDIMNHPTEADRSLWADKFDYKEFQIMTRTTFRTVFKGVVPDQETLRNSPALQGHDSVQDLLSEMDRLGYDKVVITATKMWSPYHHRDFILNYPVSLVAKMVEEGKGRIIGAASYDPFRISDSLAEIETAVREHDFRYVWFHPLSFGLEPNDRRFYPLYAKCQELGIPVGLQVGHSAEVLPSNGGRPMLVDDVAIEFPDLKINLSHTGWPWVDEWCSMLWRHPNVYGDISAYFPSSLDQNLVRFMDSSRGRHKVLFGTNGLGLERCKSDFLALDIKDSTKQMVLHDNVAEFLGL
ncbi:putative ANTIBIOTIC-RESISTANCE PROTEIN [Euzebya pacifica]|uniref:Putative ANTIBIOTIC-RESISTANCE PROTEIN n=1 Tax=Euzebya pacifica TaxID=1608957 RepID=A0A346XWQ8_9ACTN|nr:amidohydrolase family protein [Euzebya pacifica]AXV06655.1 putative ANTIBIOTIC-RESISTANCE PROTEIN [Euzebya pacifica]